MNWKKTFAIIRREYIERIRTKAFWVGDAADPVPLPRVHPFSDLGFAEDRGRADDRRPRPDRRPLCPPGAGARRHRGRAESQGSHEQGAALGAPGGPGRAPTSTRPRRALRKRVLAKEVSGYLVLEPKKLENDEVEYYSTTVSDFIALSQLERSLNRIRMRQKMRNRGLPADLAGELEKRVDFKAFKVTEKGTAEEKGAGILAAIIFMVLMYTTFFMYGGQVMRGVLEEKSNRIVEVIIASVRPTELMLGKIIGIGLVGLTQYFVWSVVAMNLSLPGVAGLVSSGDLGVPKMPVAMLGYFILFFVLGYFLYASVYTAIAAPFNTEQEATQFIMIPITLILAGFMVYPAVMNNPQRAASPWPSRSFRSRPRSSCSCGRRSPSRRPGRSCCRSRS